MFEGWEARAEDTECAGGPGFNPKSKIKQSTSEKGFEDGGPTVLSHSHTHF